jgi:hypothetical protein
MGSAALAEAAKSIRDWSLANGAHTQWNGVNKYVGATKNSYVIVRLA